MRHLLYQRLPQRILAAVALAVSSPSRKLEPQPHPQPRPQPQPPSQPHPQPQLHRGDPLPVPQVSLTAGCRSLSLNHSLNLCLSLSLSLRLWQLSLQPELSHLDSEGKRQLSVNTVLCTAVADTSSTTTVYVSSVDCLPTSISGCLYVLIRDPHDHHDVAWTSDSTRETSRFRAAERRERRNRAALTGAQAVALLKP